MNQDEIAGRWALIEKQCEALIQVARHQQGKDTDQKMPYVLPTTAFAHAMGVGSYIREVADAAITEIKA